MVDHCEPSIAQILVHQCLHIIFLKSNGDFTRLHPYIEVLEENLYADLSDSLPSLEYEKVFHLYLLSTLPSKVAFRKELKRVLARGIERINAFLSDAFAEREQSEREIYTQMMLEPQAIAGYT